MACPTCGQGVEIVSGDEGTSYYVGTDVAALTDASETVISVIVMLAGLTEPWDRLDYPERCALAENELRALDDRLAAPPRKEPN